MAAKQILYKEAGRRKLLSGMKKAFDAVKVTLGTKGKACCFG
jgi:chaperonin GroEL (HSP60 family)